MIKRLFLLNIIFVSIIFAQEKDIKEIDSLRIEQKYQHLLNGDSQEIIPLYTLGEFLDPYDSPFEVNFINHTNGSITELNSMAMQTVKNDMNQSFAIFRQGQNKYHLGV